MTEQFTPVNHKAFNIGALAGSALGSDITYSGGVESVQGHNITYSGGMESVQGHNVTYSGGMESVQGHNITYSGGVDSVQGHAITYSGGSILGSNVDSIQASLPGFLWSVCNYQILKSRF